MSHRWFLYIRYHSNHLLPQVNRLQSSLRIHRKTSITSKSNFHVNFLLKIILKCHNYFVSEKNSFIKLWIAENDQNEILGCIGLKTIHKKLEGKTVRIISHLARFIEFFSMLVVPRDIEFLCLSWLQGQGNWKTIIAKCKIWIICFSFRNRWIFVLRQYMNAEDKGSHN